MLGSLFTSRRGERVSLPSLGGLTRAATATQARFTGNATTLCHQAITFAPTVRRPPPNQREGPQQPSSKSLTHTPPHLVRPLRCRRSLLRLHCSATDPRPSYPKEAIGTVALSATRLRPSCYCLYIQKNSSWGLIFSRSNTCV